MAEDWVEVAPGILARVVWHGAVSPSPYGLGTKGELLPAYQRQEDIRVLSPAEAPDEEEYEDEEEAVA